MIFETITNGIFKTVSVPEYGKQDIGVTPGGPMDSFSHDSGNALLGNEQGAPALEILMAPVLRFREDAWFALAGARHNDVVLKQGNQSISVEHGRVYSGLRGSEIRFGSKAYGLRSYLCWRPVEGSGESPEGRVLKPFNERVSWPDRDGRIRVTEGPECRYLDGRDRFVEEHWKLTNDISDMGIRLENRWADVGISMPAGMVSEAVSNGTVQLTPDGPIILLKHRQTVGGYPRIYNVISADVDMLAQYGPGMILRFKEVSIREAHEVLRRQKADIEKIRA